jgi:hypothetical protein
MRLTAVWRSLNFLTGTTPVIPQPILEWLDDAVLNSDRTEQAARAQTIRTLQARHDQIKARIEAMYSDKLDGRITQEFFDKQSATWRGEQDGLLRKINDIRNAAPSPIDEAVDLLRLTSRASELFSQQPAAEQRRLLQVVVEKAAAVRKNLERIEKASVKL